MEPVSIDEEIQKYYTQFLKFPNLPSFLSPDTKLSPLSITIPNFSSPATTSVSSISMAPKRASSVATRKESPVATRRSKRTLCALSSSSVATGADLEINPSPSFAVKRRVRTFWGKSPHVKKSSKLVESGSNVDVAVEKGDVGGNIESSVDKDVAAEADKDGNNNVVVDVDATLNVVLNSEADVVGNVVSIQDIDADVGTDEAESTSLELVEPLDYDFFSKECLEEIRSSVCKGEGVSSVCCYYKRGDSYK